MSSGASQLSSLAQAPLAGPDRRTEVLTTALLTFARFGYRKTSMDDIAKAARISRPGLYFLFTSKEELFREAASRALEDDVADAESILADSTRPLDDRVLDAFDRWAGRYVGPMAADISIVIADNPGLMGDLAESAPRHFAHLVTDAIAHSSKKSQRDNAASIAQTLISTSVGIKHQASDRVDYRARLRVAIGLLLG